MSNKEVYTLLSNILNRVNDKYPGSASKSYVMGNVDKSFQNITSANEKISAMKERVNYLTDYLDYIESKSFIVKSDNCEYKMTIEGKVFLNKGGFLGLYDIESNKFINDSKRTTLEVRKNYFIMVAGVVGWFLAIVGMLQP